MKCCSHSAQISANQHLALQFPFQLLCSRINSPLVTGTKKKTIKIYIFQARNSSEQDNRFHKSFPPPDLYLCRAVSGMEDEEEETFTAGVKRADERLQSAPCPQWHSCSVAHIQTSSPALSAHQLSAHSGERGIAKGGGEEINNACVSLCVRGPLSSTMRVTSCSYFEGSTFYVSTHSRL